MSEICTPAIISADDLARAAEFKVPLAPEPKRVVVALSGGVDSAAAAFLLKEAGHEVIGVTLRLAPESASNGEKPKGSRCCSADDMTDARQLCDALDIPFYAIDARDRFKETVFDPWVAAYRGGLTPIPCLACNHQVKFGDLYQTAQDLDALLATGHYSKIVDYKGHLAIARPADLARDQTYYLFGVPQEVVQQLMMPLGGLDKPLVRAIAHRAGIPVFSKPDSQEICFVPDGDHGKVVERAGGAMPGGDLVHISGKKLRGHDGIHRFTIGQRRGIGVGTGEKLYVVDIDPEDQKVVVGPESALQVTKIKAKPPRLQVPLSAWPAQIMVQIRARHRAQPAQWSLDDEGALVFEFETPVSAVAPGQAAVAYDGDVLLGGGMIVGRLDGQMTRSLKESAHYLPVLQNA